MALTLQTSSYGLNLAGNIVTLIKITSNSSGSEYVFCSRVILLVHQIYLTALSSSLPQRKINFSRSPPGRNSKTMHKHSCCEKISLILLELLMVIVKLSKKFWVGKICNDRKRTRLKGHVSSETTQISCNIPSFPRSFSSLNH